MFGSARAKSQKLNFFVTKNQIRILNLILFCAEKIIRRSKFDLLKGLVLMDRIHFNFLIYAFQKQNIKYRYLQNNFFEKTIFNDIKDFIFKMIYSFKQEFFNS